ncbi:MAG: protealysin inhibitor emfourin [Chloroflexota bacterium]
MMIITFVRSGGLTREEVDLRLDLNSLSIGESQELLQLIEEADFFNLPGNMASPDVHPDEYSYAISVDTDGGQRHTVYTNDSTLPRSLLPLIEQLSHLAFATPPKS